MTPRQWKRLFARAALWALIVAAFVLAAMLAQATWSIYGKERIAREAHLDEARALAELSERKRTLSAEVKELDTPRGIEGEIRERYPLVKNGEEVIVLTDAPNAAANATAATSTPWSRFLSWFSWF